MKALKYCRQCGAVRQTYWSVCTTTATAFGIVRARLAWIQRSSRWQHSPLNLIERKLLLYMLHWPAKSFQPVSVSANWGKMWFSRISKDLLLRSRVLAHCTRFKWIYFAKYFTNYWTMIFGPRRWRCAVECRWFGNGQQPVAHFNRKFIDRIACYGPHWLPFHRRKINWKSAKKLTRLRCKSIRLRTCNTSRWTFRNFGDEWRWISFFLFLISDFTGQ